MVSSPRPAETPNQQTEADSSYKRPYGRRRAGCADQRSGHGVKVAPSRAARMRGIDRPDITAEVLKKPVNDRRRLDTGNDALAAAALPADLDVDGKDPLEALRPGEAPLAVGG